MIVSRMRRPSFAAQPRLLAIALMAIVVVFGISQLRAQSATFISVIPDLPLMDGLLEDVASAVVFETTSGRIAQSTASGPVTKSAIADFYAATLPQLGWHLQSTVRYQREGEVLGLEIIPKKDQPGHVIVHFKLTPAGP